MLYANFFPQETGQKMPEIYENGHRRLLGTQTQKSVLKYGEW